MGDPTILTATLIATCGILLGINIFFFRNIMKSIDESSDMTKAHAIILKNQESRIDMQEKQLHDIRGMREDIAVLRFAVLREIEKRDKEKEKHPRV